MHRRSLGIAVAVSVLAALAPAAPALAAGHTLVVNVAAPFRPVTHAASGGTTAATQGLAYNGGSWSTVSYPPTAGWGQFGATVSTSVNLRAGYNVIRLAKGSPFFAGGTGFAELDYIQLT